MSFSPPSSGDWSEQRFDGKGYEPCYQPTDRSQPDRTKPDDMLRCWLSGDQVSRANTARLDKACLKYNTSPKAYQYDTLPSTNSIRLLRFAPMIDICSLRFTFMISSLKEQPRYTAVSYAGGDDDKVVPLIVDGKVMHISKSLAQMLHAIPECNRQCLLWIDTICVNQVDRIEVASQVKQLASIYDLAETVLIWCPGQCNEPHWQQYRNYGLPGEKLTINTRTSLADRGCTQAPDPHLAARLPHGLDLDRSLSTPPVDQCVISRLVYDDFVDCQSLLQRVFSECKDDDYPNLSIALSAIKTSFRPLRLVELACIVASVTPTGIPLRPKSKTVTSLLILAFHQDEKTRYLGHMIRTRWSEVLCLDDQDYVSFTKESINIFFDQFSVRGIDTKHQLMAVACLKELDLSTFLPKSCPDPDDFGCKSSYRRSEFALYATDYWYMHYRLAQHTNIAISEQFHRILWPQVQNIGHPQLTHRASTNISYTLECYSCVKFASDYCKRHGLTVLGDTYAEACDGLRSRSRGCSFMQGSDTLLRDAIGQCRISDTTLNGPTFHPESASQSAVDESEASEWDSSSESTTSTTSATSHSAWLVVDHSRYHLQP